MRHHNANRKFGRPASQRRALLKSLVVALVTHDAITTTDAKARELRPFVEKMITTGKKKTLAARRDLLARLDNNEAVASKIMDVLATKYESRNGGYVRIYKLPQRLGDAALMARIEFV
jgi:large subunit ribosomal protein L17